MHKEAVSVAAKDPIERLRHCLNPRRSNDTITDFDRTTGWRLIRRAVKGIKHRSIRGTQFELVLERAAKERQDCLSSLPSRQEASATGRLAKLGDRVRCRNNLSPHSPRNRLLHHGFWVAMKPEGTRDLVGNDAPACDHSNQQKESYDPSSSPRRGADPPALHTSIMDHIRIPSRSFCPAATVVVSFPSRRFAALPRCPA